MRRGTNRSDRDFDGGRGGRRSRPTENRERADGIDRAVDDKETSGNNRGPRTERETRDQTRGDQGRGSHRDRDRSDHDSNRIHRDAKGSNEKILSRENISSVNTTDRDGRATSELQSQSTSSYAVFCLKKKNRQQHKK
eukprot:TRINITY_DN12892_c0_g1_i1.p1 TRINITY_DN12892_c0_g1~~TRINITY_DN12892_c0_g1_i1.p1  ORF type:complete len:138 (+),score=17.44 TRINITY_DN12892_c0_g1_i1:45-458(+)